MCLGRCEWEKPLDVVVVIVRAGKAVTELVDEKKVVVVAVENETFVARVEEERVWGAATSRAAS